jgi:hypothetical protein
MAEPYVPDLFVGRTVPMEDILDWAREENPAQRVLSVVGPPGVGKSYLLHRVRDLLHAAGRLVFWINLSRDLTIRGDDRWCSINSPASAGNSSLDPASGENDRGKAHPDVITEAGLRIWLAEAIQRSQARCDRVRPYDGSISPEAVLFTLVTDLCERCDLKPILIVDGFEEIDQPRRDWLEESVLAQFIGRSCTRIIIGWRDEFSLNSPALRWTEGKLTLTVMNDMDSDLQVRTRLQNWDKRPLRTKQTGYFPSADLIANFRARNPIFHYSWNHPGINTFLLERAVLNWHSSRPRLLDKQDLFDCILDITAIASARLSMHEFKLLVDLAELADPTDTTKLLDEWLEGDLTRQLKITIDDERLAELFRRGIVLNVELTARYKVADGLREALRAWQSL